MKPFELTPEQIMTAFPGGKIKTIRTYWPAIRNALQDAQLDSAAIVAYALGTIAAENAGFTPLTEMISKYNTRHSPFDQYDGRADLGNMMPGDGERFRGRGFVQLTGRANYLRYGERIGLDLIELPELVGDTKVAAQLLALFIADREPAILTALKAGNLAVARKLVNGGTHGLDRFERAYNAILEVLRHG
jgi:putative chitinase